MDIAGGELDDAEASSASSVEPYPLEREGGVIQENLLFLVLVALPLAVAVCLGLAVRSLLGHVRTWWLSLLVAAVLVVIWYVFVLGMR